MYIEPLINLFQTKEEAFYFRNSWLNQFYDFKGIQLLPNNPIKYIQATQTTNGIELEDWTVFAVDLCSGEKTDITDSFFVEALYNSDNGDNQIIWSLQNINFDGSNDLIYLEVNQAVGQTYYSNPFLITDFDSEKTELFHYRNNKYEWMQSIQVRTWFRQSNQLKELTQYYEISTRNTVTQAIKQNYLNMYESELIDIDTLIKISNLLTAPYLYVNLVRSYIFESVEIPKLANRENFGKITFNISPNKGSILNLNDLSPVVPVVPIPTPTTKTVTIVPFRYSAGLLRLDFRIDIEDGYTTIDQVNSFVTLASTGSILQPPYEFTPMVLLTAPEYSTQTPLISQTGSSSVHVKEVNLITTNGINNKIFNILDAGLIWTNAQIDAEFPQSITLNII